MIGQKKLSILNLICLIYSFKCQDLEKFVAPILDNRGAPLVAIVDTTNISSHIVRSIEMPLREIINSTIECKINETLKDDIVSSKVLKNVSNQMDTLQQKIDEHIRDSQNQFSAVKQDIIATLRQEIEVKISHEILEQMKKVTTTLNTLTKDMDEKVRNLTDNVDIMQSELRETILSVDNNVSNLTGQLKKHANKLDAFRSKLQELNVNTKDIQDGMVKMKSTAEKNSGNFNFLNSTVGAINAQLNEINSRALLTASTGSGTTPHGSIFKFDHVMTSDGINDLNSLRKNGKFTCEKDGFYLVSFFLTTDTSVCHLALYRNSNRIARVSKGSKSKYQTHSLLVLMKLKVGDTLSVEAEENVYDWGGIDSMLSVLQVK